MWAFVTKIIILLILTLAFVLSISNEDIEITNSFSDSSLIQTRELTKYEKLIFELTAKDETMLQDASVCKRVLYVLTNTRFMMPMLTLASLFFVVAGL